MKKIKSKGFTLIELLVAIVIVLSVLMVAIVSVTKISNQKKKESLGRIEDQVVTAAQTYFNANEYKFENFTSNNETLYIPLGVLVKNDYLNTLTNPTTGKKLNECDGVKVTYKNGKYLFEYASEISETDCRNDSLVYSKKINDKSEIKLELGFDSASAPVEGYDGNNWFNSNNTSKKILATVTAKNVNYSSLKYCHIKNGEKADDISNINAKNITDFCEEIDISEISKSNNDKYTIELTEEMPYSNVIVCALYDTDKQICNKIDVGVDVTLPILTFEKPENTNTLPIKYGIYCEDGSIGSGCYTNNENSIELTNKKVSAKVSDNAKNETTKYLCKNQGESGSLDLLVMIDRSGSMSTMKNFSTRLSKIRTALKNILGSIRNGYDINVSLYGYHGGATNLNIGVDIQEYLYYTKLDSGNYSTIEDKIDSIITAGVAGMGDGTPTGKALEKSYEITNARKENGRKQVVLLITDGLPGQPTNNNINSNDTIGVSSSGNSAQNQAINDAINASTKLKNNGVLVYVLGADSNFSDNPSWNTDENGLKKWLTSGYAKSIFSSSGIKIKKRETMLMLNAISSNWKTTNTNLTFDWTAYDNKNAKKLYSSNGNNYGNYASWYKNNDSWQKLPYYYQKNSDVKGNGFLYGFDDSDSGITQGFKSAFENLINITGQCEIEGS